MQYKYAAFISYRRKDPAAKWVAEYFHKNLEDKLADLHYNSQVFIDKRDIQVGDEWDEEIKMALSQSMFLIPVFSPYYFDISRYAIMELAYMNNRMLKFPELYPSKRAIIPVIYGNKDHYKCPYNMIDLYDTADIVKLQNNEEYLKKLLCEVEGLARAINAKSNSQPAYSDDFHSEDLFKIDPEKLNELCRSIYTEFDKRNNFSINML